MPVGYLRGVGYIHNVFAVETMIDELAHAADGQDPLAFRLNHLNNNFERAIPLLEKVKEQSNWQWPQTNPLRALGVAHYYFSRYPGSYLAQVVDISLNESTGEIQVHHVYTAVDCGTLVNPAQVESQVEGGSLMGVSFALKEELTFENGGVSDRDFKDYSILRMNEAPEFDTFLTQSTKEPGGIGDATNCLIAPAIANAVFNLIYRKYNKTLHLRDLPMTPEKVKRALNLIGI